MKKEEMSINDKTILLTYLDLSDDLTAEELKEEKITQMSKEILDKKGINIDDLTKLFTYGKKIIENAVIEKQGKIYDKVDDEIKEKLKNKYDSVEMFINGYARVVLNDKWGFVDTTGKEIVNPKYDIAGNFDEREFGTATVCIKEQRYKDGSIMKSAKWSFIDTDGTEYDLDYHEGLAAVIFYESCPIVKDGEIIRPKWHGWGFVNEEGKVIIPFKYQSASNFENGRAKVELRGETFYIDKQGKRVE